VNKGLVPVQLSLLLHKKGILFVGFFFYAQGHVRKLAVSLHAPRAASRESFLCSIAQAEPFGKAKFPQ
jgi:hypothetical protein